jgi:hypothetical protein
MPSPKLASGQAPAGLLLSNCETAPGHAEPAGPGRGLSLTLSMVGARWRWLKPRGLRGDSRRVIMHLSSQHGRSHGRCGAAN